MARNYYSSIYYGFDSDVTTDRRMEMQAPARKPAEETMPASPTRRSAAETPRTLTGQSAIPRTSRGKARIYVRYDEGAELYSMCKHSFMKLAADAHAVYKINRLSLVNTKIFEDYLETYRI